MIKFLVYSQVYPAAVGYFMYSNDNEICFSYIDGSFSGFAQWL